MTKQEAYERFELAEGADLQEVRRKFSEMHNDYRMRIENAPTPRMRQSFERGLESLKEAYSLLNGSAGMDDTIDLPHTGQSFRAAQAPETERPSGNTDIPADPHQTENTRADRTKQSKPNEPQQAKQEVRPAKKAKSFGWGILVGVLVVFLLLSVPILMKLWKSKKRDTAQPVEQPIVSESSPDTTGGTAMPPLPPELPAELPSAEQSSTEATVSNTSSGSRQGTITAQAKALYEQAIAFNNRKDYTQAVPLFRQAAEQGEPSAKYMLALKYELGQGVTKSETTANKWYKEAFSALQAAAAKGDADAQLRLGQLYHFAKGIKRNFTEAAKWYLQAANQGKSTAQLNLGALYADGNGVKKDFKAAVKWFRLAAEQGDEIAQDNLGVRYERGEGVKRDYAEAVKWYRKSAEQGYASAQVNLAAMYDNGNGVSKDYAQAQQWYLKAAKQGDARAQYNVGYNYDEGYGVAAISWTEAVTWYTKAANNGYATAKRKLGEFYIFGVGGLEKNRSKAVQLFRAAANEGDDYAKSYLQVISDIDQGKVHYLNTSVADNRIYMTPEDITKHNDLLPWIITKQGTGWAFNVHYSASANAHVQIFPIQRANMEKPVPIDVASFTNYGSSSPMEEANGEHSVSIATKGVEKGYRAISYVYVVGHFQGDTKEELKMKVPIMVCWKPKNAY